MSEEIRARDAGTHLTISTTHRQLLFFQGDRSPRQFPVAVGKPSTPTPPGDYTIVNKIMNPGGMLGTRWMGLSIPNGVYGIHGTSNPASIGTYASAGCIRMYNHDVEQVFPLVVIGTPVHITGGPLSSNNPSTKPAAGDGGKTYTVQPGDTLWQISLRFGVSLDALIQANNLANPDILQSGQLITIP